MKKKQIFLKTIVAILLLSAMIVSTLLGTSNAEYFKSFKKTLSLEMKPDLNLSYYLRDMTGTGDGKTYTDDYGTYKNSKNFSQEIIVGRDESTLFPTNKGQIYADAEWAKTNTIDNVTYTKYNGTNIIYQIKIPVDETGYYTLNFAVDFTKKTSDGYAAQTEEFFSQTYDRAIGCQVLNHEYLENGFSFDSNTKRLDLYTESGNDAVYADSKKGISGKENVKRFSDLVGYVYQWKTLAPSRQEYVSLTFAVEDKDVDNGYVLWMWDLAGLYGAKTYKLEFTDVSVEKIMNLDGTTNTRDSNDPYFMFAETSQVNNQILLSINGDIKSTDTTKAYAQDEITNSGELARSMNDRGKVSYSHGRGSFVTEATTNSLQLQAESIAYGYSDSRDNVLYGNHSNTYSNPLAFYVPVKNIKPNVTYKVTFDLSIARQGTYAYSDYKKGTTSEFNRNKFTSGVLADYATYSNIFKNGTNVFSSYLTNQRTDRSVNHHQEVGMTQITYNNKFYNGKYQYKDINGKEITMYAPLTKYDEVTSLGSIYNSISTNVNDTYSKEQLDGDDRSKTRNWYNAVQNIEYNGQNKINWLTFYNTTFSFNIDMENGNSSGLNVDSNGYITNLEWAWVIDSVIPMSYYRIRLDNVRIQEVVEYGSFLDRNGVLIGDEKLTTDFADHYGPDTDNYNPKTSGWLNGLFVSYRGTNGTGQNFQAKGSVLNEYTALKKAQVFMSEGNIYAPMVDASKIPIANGKDSDYKISISGYAVCQGGIDRYVFSVDGGITWHDMTLNGIDTDARSADGDLLSKAGNAVNQYASGQTSYHKKGTNNGNNEFTWTASDLRPTYDECTHIAFTSNDAQNGNFKAQVNGSDKDPDPDFGWCLSADLSAFKHQGNLDIIIAAVPETNQDLRCEILRIINYNATQKYYTHAQNIVSDIKVTNATSTIGESQLNAFYYTPDSINDNCENKENFTALKGYRADSVTSKTQQQLGAYTNRLLDFKNYEDVPALFSDIPVYTKLSISGWAAAEKGIESFYWTVDGGKTWYPCGDDASASYGVTKTISLDTTTNSISTIKDRLKAWWGTTYTNDEIKSMSSYFHEWVSATDTFTGYIQADLSAYEGQVVDVLFAAKPNNSDVYVPVAKVDNVGVYGAQGTFFTRLADTYMTDGKIYEAGVIFDHNASYRTFIGYDKSSTQNTELHNEVTDKWNVSLTEGFAYTIFNVNNVNPVNSRYYTNQVYTIKSGGKVSINGYVVAKGGIKEYQFSLDGGETWTVIGDKGTSDAADTNKGYAAKYSDASLTDADATNGCFLTDRLTSDKPTSSNITGGSDYMLNFNIPALPQGSQRDLLVVAVNNSGKMLPVVHLKLEISGYVDANNKYGYYSNLGEERSGWVNADRASTFSTGNSAARAKLRDKITIPVSEVGEHTMTFGLILKKTSSSGSNVTDKNLSCTIYHDEGYKNEDDGRLYTSYSAMNQPIVGQDDSRVCTDSQGNKAYWKGTVAANFTRQTIKFNVTKEDVARGYVVWEWNTTELATSTTYYFKVENFVLTTP